LTEFFRFCFYLINGFEGPKYLQNNSNYVYDKKFRKFFLKWSNNILKLSPPVRQLWRYHGKRGFNSLILQYLLFLLYKMIGFNNAPCLHLKNLHKHCLRFQEKLQYPGEITNKGYRKLYGVNEVSYGRCANRQFKNSNIKWLNGRSWILISTVFNTVNYWHFFRFFPFNFKFTSVFLLSFYSIFCFLNTL